MFDQFLRLVTSVHEKNIMTRGNLRKKVLLKVTHQYANQCLFLGKFGNPQNLCVLLQNTTFTDDTALTSENVLVEEREKSTIGRMTPEEILEVIRDAERNVPRPRTRAELRQLYRQQNTKPQRLTLKNNFSSPLQNSPLASQNALPIKCIPSESQNALPMKCILSEAQNVSQMKCNPPELQVKCIISETQKASQMQCISSKSSNQILTTHIPSKSPNYVGRASDMPYQMLTIKHDFKSSALHPTQIQSELIPYKSEKMVQLQNNFSELFNQHIPLEPLNEIQIHNPLESLASMQTRCFLNMRNDIEEHHNYSEESIHEAIMCSVLVKDSYADMFSLQQSSPKIRNNLKVAKHLTNNNTNFDVNKFKPKSNSYRAMKQLIQKFEDLEHPMEIYQSEIDFLKVKLFTKLKKSHKQVKVLKNKSKFKNYECNMNFKKYIKRFLKNCEDCIKTYDELIYHHQGHVNKFYSNNKEEKILKIFPINISKNQKQVLSYFIKNRKLIKSMRILLSMIDSLNDHVNVKYDSRCNFESRKRHHSEIDVEDNCENLLELNDFFNKLKSVKYYHDRF